MTIQTKAFEKYFPTLQFVFHCTWQIDIWIFFLNTYFKFSWERKSCWCKIAWGRLCSRHCWNPSSRAYSGETIFWWGMLRQTLAHALVRVTITVFQSSVIFPSRGLHAFVVHGITCSTTVEQIKGQELALVQGILLEHNCGSQHAIDRSIFKFVKTCVILQ